MEKEDRIKRANEIAKLIDGKTWIKGDNMRIYTNGYVIIDDNGNCNIDNVNGHIFMDIKKILNDNNIETYRR